MPSLLAPAFLAGLVALLVPVLVHLRMRERKASVPFPSLMFIQRVPHKSLRRRTLQNLVVFAARCLAIGVLCFAFARPFFPASAVGATPTGPVGRVIALDVSGSMSYGDVFVRATAEAAKVVQSSAPADWVGVLFFSDTIQGVTPPTTDRNRALAAIQAAVPGSRSTRYAAALRFAADWLAPLPVDRREIVVITDGQVRGLTGVQEVALPARTTVVARSVRATDTDNVSVGDISVEHVREADRSFGIVTARLTHQGPSERPVVAMLEVSGRRIEEKRLTLPASGAMPVTFARAPLPEGASRARVFVETDRFPADDALHFVLGSDRDIAVLLVDEAPFVARALEIGDQPSFDILRRGSVQADDLARRDLAILSGTATTLTPQEAAALSSFVERGGGLIALSPLSTRGGASRLTPVPWGDNVNRMADRGASLGFVDLDHPALFAFKQARGSDFSRARFLQFRTVRPAADGATPYRTLARFDDGRDALLEWSLGAGRVLSFTSAVDGVMSDLPVQPLFLPLVHELARYASSHESTPLFHRVGSAADFRATDANPRADRVESVTRPDGRRERLPEGVTSVELDAPGFFEARRASGRTDIVGANLDVAESDLTTLDQGELQAALRPARPLTESQAAPDAGPDAAREWWKAALVALLLLTLTEAVLANERGRKHAP